MPTSSAVASRPELAASGTAGLSRTTTSGALPSFTAVVRLFSRSAVAAEVRVSFVPSGAQAFTYAAHSELSSFCGYGSQKVIVLSEAAPAGSSLLESSPQAASAPTIVTAATAAPRHLVFFDVNTVFLSESCLDVEAGSTGAAMKLVGDGGDPDAVRRPRRGRGRDGS